MNNYCIILKDYPKIFKKFDKFVKGWASGSGMTEADFHQYFNKFLKKKYNIKIQMEHVYHNRREFINHVKSKIISTNEIELENKFKINLDFYETWDYVYKEMLKQLLNKL